MSIETSVFAVQRGGQQFSCKGSELREKLTDGDLLLVNRDGVDCKLKLKKFIGPWNPSFGVFHIIVPPGSLGVKTQGQVNVYHMNGEIVPDADILLEGEYIVEGKVSRFRDSPGDFEIGKQTVTSTVTDMSYLFTSCRNFTGKGIEYIDVFRATNLSYMFRNCSKLNGDLSRWDVSNAENMYHMFDSASVFTSDLSWWDVSKVRNMEYMFNKAAAFDTDCSYWCVEYFELGFNKPGEPRDFATGATNFKSRKPKWGVTCGSPKPGSPPPLPTSISPTEVSS